MSLPIPSHRCSSCGRPLHEIEFLPGEEREPMACPDHPEAAVLRWSPDAQAVALWAAGERANGRTWRELYADITPAQTAVLILLEDWGGELPERKTERTGPASPAGLFGRR